MRASESIRFCITMVDYKMHSQKISALATPKKGVIFHVENWCRMKGPPQFEDGAGLIPEGGPAKKSVSAKGRLRMELG